MAAVKIGIGQGCSMALLLFDQRHLWLSSRGETRSPGQNVLYSGEWASATSEHDGVIPDIHSTGLTARFGCPLPKSSAWAEGWGVGGGENGIGGVRIAKRPICKKLAIDRLQTEGE